MNQLSRRAALLGAGAAAATLWAEPIRAQATGPYALPKLGYGFDANEPYIDAQTMEIHHDRHHAAYVANLNAALKDYPKLGAMSADVLLSKLGQVPDSIRTLVRNNAGGHVNHSMFWQVMGGKGGEPGGALAAAISRDFGDLASLQSAFNKAGAGVFGSGWVFVTVNKVGRLTLVPRPNQDSPIIDGQRALFGNDVWEHAYYLKYQNKRADYLAAWWNVLDWSKIEARYSAAMVGTLTI